MRWLSVRISGKTYVTRDYVTASRGNNHFYCTTELVCNRPRTEGIGGIWLCLKSRQNVNKLFVARWRKVDKSLYLPDACNVCDCNCNMAMLTAAANFTVCFLAHITGKIPEYEIKKMPENKNTNTAIELPQHSFICGNSRCCHSCWGKVKITQLQLFPWGSCVTV